MTFGERQSLSNLDGQLQNYRCYSALITSTKAEKIDRMTGKDFVPNESP